MTGQRIGYIRVSTFDQNPERQLEGVKVDRAFSDKASGKDVKRPQLEALISFARTGDTPGRGGITSFVVNQPIKRLMPRKRPDREHFAVSVGRQVPLPTSPSFPSGHSASAFAFAEGAQWVFNSWDKVTGGADGIRWREQVDGKQIYPRVSIDRDSGEYETFRRWLVVPDEPIASEGRVGVLRARAQETEDLRRIPAFRDALEFR